MPTALSNETKDARAALIEVAARDLGVSLPDDLRPLGCRPLSSLEVDFVVAMRGLAGLVRLAEVAPEAIIQHCNDDELGRAQESAEAAGWMVGASGAGATLMMRRSPSGAPTPTRGTRVLVAWLLLASSSTKTRAVEQEVRCVLSALNAHEGEAYDTNMGMYASLVANMDDFSRVRAAVDLGETVTRLSAVTGLECSEDRRRELQRIVHRVMRGFPMLAPPTRKRSTTPNKPRELFASRASFPDGGRESPEHFLLRVYKDAILEGLDGPTLREMDDQLYRALAREKTTSGQTLLSLHLTKGTPGRTPSGVDRTDKDRDQARLRMQRLRARRGRPSKG